MTRREVKISEIIIPKYLEIFNDRQHKHIILTSGRAGAKSSGAAIRADYSLISDASASVVVLRKHHNKLRKTVYKEMLRGFNRLGVPKRKLRIGKSPMEITYKRTGATMYFAGSDGIDDTKGIIDEDRPIKLVVLDELTEFFDSGEGEDELLNIEATFARGNKGDFQMIYIYNPPKNPHAPINKWCRKMEQRPDCIHIHTDYRDVPEGWLGPDLIASAEMLKAIDERQYRWLWLGEPVGVDEVIYYMFGERHKYRPEGARYKIIGIGGDYGQQNATTFQAFGLNLREHKLEGLKEFYHSGRDSGHQKSPSEYATELLDMVEVLRDKYSCNTFYLFLDPSAKGLKEEIKRQNRDRRLPLMAHDANNDVKLGISRVQKLLRYDMMTISPDQANAIEEFTTYEYDKKALDAGREVPVKTDDHAMDAIRYMVMGMWKHVKNYLPVKDNDDEVEAT